MTDQLTTPLYMRRERFDPDPEITRSREVGGGCPVVTPFGLSAELVSRYDDVRAVLANAARFSNAETGILGAAAAAAVAVAVARPRP
ncbi:hypothetical protein ND748_27070, partial [Frankia sp. AiPs1]|nr:hypothetical protein [Frankia sp. AiPs1]